MSVITYEGRQLDCPAGDSVLDILLKHHISVPWSCRAGLCHSCLVQATEGAIPAQAQRGLTREQQQQGLLLACQCRPQSPLVMQPLRRALQPMPAIITAITRLTPTLIELTLSPRQPLDYRPGQFLTISREKGVEGNRYTLISRPWSEADIRVHIARRISGEFSAWVFDHGKPGMQLWLEGLGGECCFHPDHHQPLIIYGAEEGIGAALAVAEDAQWHQHRPSLQLLLQPSGTPLEAFHHEFAEPQLQTVTGSSLTQTVRTLLNTQELHDARWLLFGQPKKVLALTALLGEQGAKRHQVFSLAYRSSRER